ncbi:hypothetical protein TNIN_460531 [Trichonephila inaurata madagascariensis]|uniref:Uncharacterized protein n=1 Tax=Trichonephila inaurata madagascariensis TaxID=2747483 RepID=A0A8X6XVW0_9ARAC|nr:hypothetical protein TNIN_460531 [Trichonephila inaurata madagascariensis]
MLFWRVTAALTCSVVLSPAFWLKPDIPIKPEHRATAARKLRRLIQDLKNANSPKFCKMFRVPLLELLQWLETSETEVDYEEHILGLNATSLERLI